MLFGTWLHDARVRDREAGVDHRELACYGEKLTPYVQEHLAKALQGLERLYMRIPSTLLDEKALREQWEEFRPQYIRDIRTALESLAAALTAVGCTDEQLAEAVELLEVEKKNDEKSESAPETEGEAPEQTVMIPVVAVAIEKDGEDTK